MTEDQKQKLREEVRELTEKIDSFEEYNFIPEKIVENFRKAVLVIRTDIHKNNFEGLDNKILAIKSLVTATQAMVDMKKIMDSNK